MNDDEKFKFIDMIETKQGWIQDEFANLSDVITNNDEIEFLDDPRVIYEFAIDEAKDLIAELKRKIQFIDDNR